MALAPRFLTVLLRFQRRGCTRQGLQAVSRISGRFDFTPVESDMQLAGLLREWASLVQAIVAKFSCRPRGKTAFFPIITRGSVRSGHPHGRNFKKRWKSRHLARKNDWTDMPETRIRWQSLNRRCPRRNRHAPPVLSGQPPRRQQRAESPTSCISSGSFRRGRAGPVAGYFSQGRFVPQQPSTEFLTCRCRWG